MLYEMICLFPGSKEDSVIAQSIEKVKELLSQEGGKILSEETIGRRLLGYRIKGEREGWYHVFLFEAEPLMIQGLQKKITLLQEVLRLLIMKKEKTTMKPRRRIRVPRRPKPQEPIVKTEAIRKEKAELMSDEKIKELDKKLDDILSDVKI